MDTRQGFSKFFGLSLLIHGALAALVVVGFMQVKPWSVLHGGVGGSGPLWVGLTGSGAGTPVVAEKKEMVKIAHLKTAAGRMAFAATARPSTTLGNGEGKAGGGDGLPFGSSQGDWSSPLWSEIRSRIESSKFYPQLARRQGIVGTSHARFQIGEGGIPQNILIEKTSGSSLLDDATIVAIRRAAPFPKVPSFDGWVRFPLTYDLKGEES